VTVRRLGPGDHAAYDRFVGGRPEATIYHTRQWHELLADVFGYQPRVLVAAAGDEITGALPLALVDTGLGGRRLVSLPFSHRVALLGRDGPAAAALLDAVADLAMAERCRFVEIRSGDRPGAAASWADSTEYVVTTMALAPDEAVQMAGLRPNTRQQLAQGLRHPDLRLETRSDEDGVGRFARLIAATRRRKGSLTYPARFYQELRRRFIERGMAHLDLAFAGDRCIAGLLTFVHGQQAIYGYSGSVEDADDLRLRPINVLMWRGINWAREQGAREFDFGTSLPTQPGLIRFKEGWGGTSRPLPYQVWRRAGRRGRIVAQDGVTTRLASSVLRRLPQPLFTRLTPYLLRQVG